MNEWVLFTIGIFIGGIAGVMTIALISANKTADLYSEIQDLRTQRKLLKDCLLYTSPSPRDRQKYRKKRNVRPK